MTKPDQTDRSETAAPAVGTPLDCGVGRLVPERDESSAEERYCHEALTALRLAFERDAKPYIDRLVGLRSMSPVRYTMLVHDPGCWCARCDMEHNVRRTRMSVCNKCGDKRCPRAEDHRNECRETPNVQGNLAP